MYLVSWGFIKWLFKCSKINELGNTGFSFLRFWHRPSTYLYYLHQKAEIISIQTVAQIQIIAYNADNGKTSRLYTSNIFLQHKPASNQSRNKPINPPPTYHPVVIIFLSRISHQQLISITIIPQNCLHNDLLYFLLWHFLLCNH